MSANAAQIARMQTEIARMQTELDAALREAKRARDDLECALVEIKSLKDTHKAVIEAVAGYASRATQAYQQARDALDPSLVCLVCKGQGWYETGNNDLICTCSKGHLWQYLNGQIVRGRL